MEIQRGDIVLHIIPLTDLKLQTPPPGSCFDRVVENPVKGYHIYGNYEGNADLEHFPGFANYNQRPNCTGFGLILGRKGLPVDVEGNPAPLYIGLTTLEEISGDGIYQPDGWSKKGVLYPEDLPEPETWYWVWASFPEAPYPDTFHCMLAGTDAYFAEGSENYWLWGAIDGEIEEYPKTGDVFRGWKYGGWSSIPDMLCFFTWTECEAPVCTNPSGTEGQVDACGIGSGNQPDATHKYKCVSGTWVDQGYNPDCVTPVCTNPPGTEGQIDVCGVGYGNQPDATHKYKCVSGTWVDQGYNPECVGIVCKDYTDETSCINAGCEWWNNECRSYAPTCIELDNKADCERYKCYWYNDSCHAEPQTPTDFLPWAVVAVGVSLIVVAVVKT